MPQWTPTQHNNKGEKKALSFKIEAKAYDFYYLSKIVYTLLKDMKLHSFI
jgi:hypothetical protein